MRESAWTGRAPGIGLPAELGTLFLKNGRLLALSSLSFGWAVALFDSGGLWSVLAPGRIAQAHTVFVVATCAALVAVLALAAPERSFTVLIAFDALAAAAAPLLFLSGPNSVPGWAAIAGAAAGASLAVVILANVYGIDVPSRFLPLTASLIGYYAVSALIAFLAPILGKAGLVALLCSLLTASCGLAFVSKRPAGRSSFGGKPFPASLIGLFAALVFVNYFAYYAFDAANRALFPGPPAIGIASRYVWVPRIAGAAAFLLLGSRAHLIRAFYASVGLMVLSFALRLIGPAWAAAAETVMGLSYALTDVSIGTMVLDISYQHGRRRSILIIVGLSVGIAIVGAAALGARLALIGTAPLLGGLTAFVCLIFAPLPWVLSFFDRELSAVSPLAEPSGEEAVRNLSYARISPDRAIGILRGHFDGEYRLSDREAEVARLLLDRYDYGTIASLLGISVNTAKVHAKNIYRKCDVSGRKSLIALAARLGEGKKPA